MGGKTILALAGLLAGAGLLTGCCLFSGTPRVTLTANPMVVPAGQTVVLTAKAEGGTPPYTYEWSGVVGSGRTVTAIFQAPGSYTISVEVIDSCGKRAEDMVVVTVSGNTASCGDLTGYWQGEIVEYTGRVFEIRLQLAQAGSTIQGTAYQGGRAATGMGSLVGCQFVFTFPFWYSPWRDAVLTGTVTGNEIRGTWRVGTTLQHNWWVRKEAR